MRGTLQAANLRIAGPGDGPKLTEDELAPDWYEPETKKRKASASLTKDLEKKKAANIAVDEEDEMLGALIPTRR